MQHIPIKKRIGSALGGAIATGTLPVSVGIADWKVIAGCAAVGAVGGLFGIQVAPKIQRAYAGWKGRKAPTSK